MVFRIGDRVKTDGGDEGSVIAIDPDGTAIVDFEHAAVRFPLTSLRIIEVRALAAASSEPCGSLPNVAGSTQVAGILPAFNLPEVNRDPASLLRPISSLAASCILARHVGGLLPMGGHDARWYANPSNGLLAAVMRSEWDTTWHFAILHRDDAGDFQKVADGDGFPTLDDARKALFQKRRELLPQYLSFA
jgi:hypothetical protein